MALLLLRVSSVIISSNKTVICRSARQRRKTSQRLFYIPVLEDRSQFLDRCPAIQRQKNGSYINLNVPNPRLVYIDEYKELFDMATMGICSGVEAW